MTKRRDDPILLHNLTGLGGLFNPSRASEKARRRTPMQSAAQSHSPATLPKPGTEPGEKISETDQPRNGGPLDGPG